MNKLPIILFLSIAVICKGEQQASQDVQQKQQHQQQQSNYLFPSSNKPRSDIEVEQQKIEDKPYADSYRPITFPSSEEDIQDRFQPPPAQTIIPTFLNQNANLILQSVDQKLPAPSPYAELERPTRVAVAATTSSLFANRYTDDQLDYVRDFSWNMFQGSKIPSAIGNLVLSPIQPQLQLSLLRTAAADLTEEEIANAIREVNPGVTRDLISNMKISNSLSTNLGVASAIFAKKNLQLNNSFVQAAHDRSVDIVPVNFESNDEAKYVINNWVSNATNNRIREFFKPSDAINGDTQVILTNSIYFNGEWKFGFNEVKSEPFYTTQKLSKNVPMMKNLVSLRTGTISLRNGFSGQWVELPYRGDEFSMVLILPTQRFYLDEFIRSMRATDFSDVLKQLNSSYKKLVHLSMPKFSTSTSFSLVNVLLKMGVVDLFSQTSRMPYLTVNGLPVRVQDIIQKGFLSVDEKGTIAAVATIAHVVTLSLNSAPEEIFFNVDQPFISVIVDKRNRVPVFISKIFDP